MAKIMIVGSMVYIEMDFSMEDIEIQKKFSPENLILKDSDGNLNFFIDTDDEEGVWSPNAVLFGRQSLNGNVCQNIDIPRKEKDPFEWVAIKSNILGVYHKLCEIESKISNSRDEISRLNEDIVSSIVVL